MNLLTGASLLALAKSIYHQSHISLIEKKKKHKRPVHVPFDEIHVGSTRAMGS